MAFNIWLSNFARLAADEISQGQKGYQQILRERFLSACANNTDVSIRQFTLPSTIAETTPKIREYNPEYNQERSDQDNENANSGSENDKEKSDDSGETSSSDSEESEKSESEEEDSEKEALVRNAALAVLQQEQKKSKK